MSGPEPPAGSPPPEDRPPLEPLRQVDHGRVLIDRAVLEMVREHVASDSTVEHGGILVGHVDEDAGITIVIDAIRGVGTVTRSASLTFTHETWDHVNDVMAERYPHAKMVGWYHSHPGFGIFLSDYDQFIHRNFFLERWQVAYVDDPVLDKWGFFGWDGQELVRFGRWGTWSTDDGDGPMTEGATVAPAPVPPPSAPADADAPPAPPGGPVITVEADPEPDDGEASVRGWMLGAGLFVFIALAAFLLFSVLSGDDDDAGEGAGAAAFTPEAGDAPDPADNQDPADDTNPSDFPDSPAPEDVVDAALGDAVVQVLNGAENPDTDEAVDCAAGRFAESLEDRVAAHRPGNASPTTDTTVEYAEPAFAAAAQEIADDFGIAAVPASTPIEDADIRVILGQSDAEEQDQGWELAEGGCAPGDA